MNLYNATAFKCAIVVLSAKSAKTIYMMAMSYRSPGQPFDACKRNYSSSAMPSADTNLVTEASSLMRAALYTK